MAYIETFEGLPPDGLLAWESWMSFANLSRSTNFATQGSYTWYNASGGFEMEAYGIDLSTYKSVTVRTYIDSVGDKHLDFKIYDADFNEIASEYVESTGETIITLDLEGYTGDKSNCGFLLAFGNGTYVDYIEGESNLNNYTLEVDEMPLDLVLNNVRLLNSKQVNVSTMELPLGLNDVSFGREQRGYKLLECFEPFPDPSETTLGYSYSGGPIKQYVNDFVTQGKTSARIDTIGDPETDSGVRGWLGGIFWPGSEEGGPPINLSLHSNISLDVRMDSIPTFGWNSRIALRVRSLVDGTTSVVYTPSDTLGQFRLFLDLSTWTTLQKSDVQICIYVTNRLINDSNTDVGWDDPVQHVRYIYHIDNLVANLSQGLQTSSMNLNLKLNDVGLLIPRVLIEPMNLKMEFRGKDRTVDNFSIEREWYTYTGMVPPVITNIIYSPKTPSVPTSYVRFLGNEFLGPTHGIYYSNTPWNDNVPQSLKDRLLIDRNIKFFGTLNPAVLNKDIKIFMSLTFGYGGEIKTIESSINPFGPLELTLDLRDLDDDEIQELAQIQIGIKTTDGQNLGTLGQNLTLTLDKLTTEHRGPELLVGKSLPIETLNLPLVLNDVRLIGKSYNLPVEVMDFDLLTNDVNLKRDRLLSVSNLNLNLVLPDVSYKQGYVVKVNTLSSPVVLHPVDFRRTHIMGVSTLGLNLKLNDVKLIGPGVTLSVPPVMFRYDLPSPNVSKSATLHSPASEYKVELLVPEFVGQSVVYTVEAPAVGYTLELFNPVVKSGVNLKVPTINFNFKTGTPNIYEIQMISCQGDQYPIEHIQDSKELEGDAYIDLFELLLAGQNSSIYLTMDSTKRWQGKTYEGTGIKLTGVSKSADEEQSRPQLGIYNPDNVFSYLVDQGMLENATVRRIRVLKQHIENDTPISRTYQWRISRIASVVDSMITCELRSMLDGPNFLTPARMFIPPEFPAVSLS